MSEAERLHRRAATTFAEGLAAAAQAAQVQAQVATLSGHGTDERRTARVRVDHRGLLVAVQLSPDATADGTDALRSAVLSAYAEAIADVRAQAQPLQATLTAPAVDLSETSLLDDFDALLRGTGGAR
ncbi:YbaB/EbfC family nucleoid-associated protein [Cellulomonas soli]|uniref:YbaB/EbfC DNA-binding family protein n=1 Tax=Cellulomonas soli TaxID=931535 RepID=A0A512PEE2_9CELL|nr:YbaB/EbfC family nucleoid-associated protein [Cellulomonas soli]NYI58964.1 DNA-binding protein YbaB [Cellulomonas soli]GEP69543.1 hypothetical protein CSO01_22580 [Cellulomonas soli]